MRPQNGSFTIFGGFGFVGSLLAAYLRAKGENCVTPPKNETAGLIEASESASLGHVIFCAGITSDFRSRPFDTMEAHVSLANKILAKAHFESFTYISSTRLYIRAETTLESAAILVDPSNPEDLFNISKLAGESLCRQYRHKNARSIRLSNVVGANFGSNDFLFSVIREATTKHHVTLQTSLDSEKDYIHADDAVELIARIAIEGTKPIYNVAYGRNITNAEVVGEICTASSATSSVAPGARTIRFTPIDVGLVKSEFGFDPRPVLPLIGSLTCAARR